MAGSTTGLKFAATTVGKPLLLSLLDDGDPRTFSHEPAHLADLNRGDVQTAIALPDKSPMKHDAADLSTRPHSATRIRVVPRFPCGSGRLNSRRDGLIAVFRCHEKYSHNV